MGGGYKPSAEEKEAQRLQQEELQRQQREAEQAKREAEELAKAKRAGGSSLMTGESAGESSGYKSLLGG